MPARSIRWRRASSPSRWARRPRPSLTPWMPRRPTATRRPGARRARHRRPPRVASPRPRDVRPTREAITRPPHLPRFTGELVQVPPAYSAIKVQGERAYDLARDGQEVILEPRTVGVHWRPASQLGQPDPDHAEFEILCGKGTYVRSWVRDIALALGTLGHVSALRRTRIGGFTEDMARPLSAGGGFCAYSRRF